MKSMKDIKIDIFERKRKVWLPWLVVLIISLVAARGLFRDTLLSGHDAASQAVNQEQFHRTLAEGVTVPRWDGDGRYGYGHAKLQYRPPLFHYLTEFWRLLTGRPLLALNLALATLVAGAGLGMYGACWQHVRAPAAMVGAAAYATANYLLADIYLRGAYSEVAALACLPWVIWGQTRCLRGRAGCMEVLATSFAWLALILGHPQMFVLFLPLAAGHLLWGWNEYRKNRGVLAAILAGIGGVLLAAPYWLVAWRELPWVRMELFGLGLEAYPQHFIGWRELILERWPDAYQRFAWQDWLGRPRHWEMRRLDLWLFPVVVAAFVLWLRTDRITGGRGQTRRLAILCLVGIAGSLLMALPASRGLWWLMPWLHTFNFPWRALGMTSLAAATLAALVFEETRRRFRLREDGWLAALAVVAMLGWATWPDSVGWPDTEFSPETLTAKILRQNDDIPQQFYTPIWVCDYAREPAKADAWVLEGDGEVALTRRGMTCWDLAIIARSPIRLAVAHHAWPGWRLDGVGTTPLTPEVFGTQGLMAFQIPQGTWSARLRLGTTPAQRQGWGVAGLGLAWLGLGAYLLRKKKIPPRRA
jgi:hypothetical protein